MRRTWSLVVLVVALAVLRATTTPIAQSPVVFYVGNFTGSAPLDDGFCGTGKGTTQASHPCRTLAFWTASRQATLLTPGNCPAGVPCQVRITQPIGGGAHASAADTNCVSVTFAGNVIFEGYNPDDTPIPNPVGCSIATPSTCVWPVKIDQLGNTSTAGTCRGRGVMIGFNNPGAVDNVTVRNLQFLNGHGGADFFRPSATKWSRHHVLDHVSIRGMNGGAGVQVGNPPGTSNEQCDCNDDLRRIGDITVVDSEVMDNPLGAASGGGALYASCSTGIRFIRTRVIHNCYGGGGDCDAVKFSGVLYGTIEDMDVDDTGNEGNLDGGGHYSVTDSERDTDQVSHISVQRSEFGDKVGGLNKLNFAHALIESNVFHFPQGFAEAQTRDFTFAFNTMYVSKVDSELINFGGMMWKRNQYKCNIIRGVANTSVNFITTEQRNTHTAGGDRFANGALDWDYNVIFNDGTATPNAWRETDHGAEGCGKCNGGGTGCLCPHDAAGNLIPPTTTGGTCAFPNILTADCNHWFCDKQSPHKCTGSTIGSTTAGLICDVAGTGSDAACTGCSGGQAGACSPASCLAYQSTCDAEMPYPDFCLAMPPNQAGQANGSAPLNAAGLATFQAQNNAGQWFDAGTAAHDKWQQKVTFKNAAGGNLELDPTDSVARNACTAPGGGLPFSFPAGKCCTTLAGCGLTIPPTGRAGWCRAGLEGHPCDVDADCTVVHKDKLGVQVVDNAPDIGAFEAGDPNDPCVVAGVLPPTGGVTSGTVAATEGVYSGTCGNTLASKERVYSWTPSGTGSAVIETCGAGTTFDTAVYVRTGNCATGSQLACTDDTPGCTISGGTNKGSRVTFAVNAGETYYVFVDGLNGAAGTFQLTVTPPPSPTTTSNTVVTTSTSTAPSVSTSSSIVTTSSSIVTTSTTVSTTTTTIDRPPQVIITPP